MVRIQHQYQCSSRALAYNASIFVKSRPSYLIIDIEPIVEKSQITTDQSYASRLSDYLSHYASDEIPVVIVSLNITESNITINGSRGKIFEKNPSVDTSLNNIIIGIGAVAVVLILLVIVIKLIHKCYKLYTANDDEEKEPARKSPLLPTSTSNVVRRNSSLRNPSVPVRRSSLNLQTQMELQQKRWSQPFENTPPIAKKP